MPFVKDDPRINREGRPKGSPNKPKFIDEIDEELEKMAEGKDYTYKQALRKTVLKKMIVDGDGALIREYWQQKDGKAPQKFIGDSDNPLFIKVIKEIADKNGLTDTSTINNSEGQTQIQSG